MTEISGPWNGIITGDSGPYSATDWQLIWQQAMAIGADNNRGVLAGVLNELEVVATSPVSNQVEVSTGAALVQGIWYYNDTASAVSISANASGSTRIDVIVLEAVYASQTVRISKVQGTPGGGVPSLTQTPGAVWQIPLAYVTAANGFVTLAQSTITDLREYANLPPQVAVPVTNDSASVLEIGAVTIWDSGGGADVNTTTTNAATSVAGVIERRTLAGGTGRIIVSGVFPVTVNAATAIGDLLVTSTTAGRATPITANQRNYVVPFARALTAASGAGERVLAYIQVPVIQTGGSRFATGTYTGNGAATQAVTGIPFQPRALIVYTQTVGLTSMAAFKNDLDGTSSYTLTSGFAPDHIISLDANGFTVGDGTGSTNQFNVNLRLYTYMAWG